MSGRVTRRRRPDERPRDGFLADIGSLHLLVRVAILEALNSGPAETIDERINYGLFRDLGQMAVEYMDSSDSVIADTTAQMNDTTNQIAQNYTRRCKQISAAAIGASFAPKGWFVYLLYTECDDEQPIYIGMSGNVLSRLGQHMQNPDRRHRVQRVALIRCESEDAARATESTLIADYQPELNRVGIVA